jgi:hypothetical protein
MELKEFIKETIIQISEGIRASQKYIDENNLGEGIRDDKGKEINFDVAVTSEEQDTTGLGGKISIASIISLGGEDTNTLKSSNLSRIQFKLYLKINAKDK